MDFLFAPLPDTNFKMTDDQLVLWQRNAIFECECDNFINRRIEDGRSRHLPNLMRRPLVEQSAIDAAIQQHGLHPRCQYDDSTVVPERHDMTAQPPPSQRPRTILSQTNVDHQRDSTTSFDSFYQEAIAVAIRERGLGLIRNSS